MATERFTYEVIQPEEYRETIRSNPLWYIDEKLGPLITEFFINPPPSERTEAWDKKKQELLHMFIELLDVDEVALGNEPEGFNDDDRWIQKYFGVNPRVEKDHPDTMIIHHTHTDPNVSYQYLNALGLLRLYLPVFRSKAFMKDGKYQPISSGHLYQGKQTFVGYHYIIREDGTIEQLLKDEYTGFHAGDYGTNCKSIGVAIVSDLTEKGPTQEALAAVNQLIETYEPEFVLGHGEVVKANGERVDAECPGKTFYEENGWKKLVKVN